MVMVSSIEKLRKFLNLEIKRNFDNKAIVGGLDKILPSWVPEALAETDDTEKVSEIKMRIELYHAQSQGERSTAITQILDLLNLFDNIQEPEESQSMVQEEQPRPIPEMMDKSHLPLSSRIDYNKMLNSPVTTITGVGASMAKKLAQLGITTINDLLLHFPRRYEDFSKLIPINRLEYGDEVTAIGTIKSIVTHPTKNPKVEITEAVLTDGTGFLRLTWFNQKYLENTITPEMQIVVSGKIERYLGRLVINNPEWEKLEKEQLHTNRIVPVYSLTADVKQRSLRNLIYKAVSYWAPRIEDYMPQEILQNAGLIDLSTAMLQIHFPDSMEELELAQQRIAFDEIFLLQMGVLQQKREWQSNKASVLDVPDQWLDEQIEKIPFSLTQAQKRVVREIKEDLASGVPMNRLLQGDVGSGKTIIAALASAIVYQNGAQVAVLAPTSILAEQHYNTLKRILSCESDSALQMMGENAIKLLIGDTPEKEKTEIIESLSSGEIKVLIGTHAILEEPVQFNNLQLAVIDEQHRFGVKQRATLRMKGDNPHLLVMTATPIPRSLALTIYGDLDVSVLDEMPVGRQVIQTHVLHPIERERAYSLIRSQIEHGYQAFIVYPLIEEGENENSKAAVSEYERLKEHIFSNDRLGLLHGRMKQEEKDAIMTAFRDGQYDILVSTTVIEVGVDVPNATVMLIEGANRFGLAQLHQLRGRVGRGDAKSYCILIPETQDAVENERLAVMSATNDGFLLAEQDLNQRGPGEFLGTRQSGYSNLKIAKLTDVKLIEKARHFSRELFDHDPDLQLAENRNLKPLIQYYWEEGRGDIS